MRQETQLAPAVTGSGRGDILRPYQWQGHDWLWNGRRKMLTDDVGMGKTRTAALASTEPVLVACPAYLFDGWRDEIKRVLQFSDADISIARGESHERVTAIEYGAPWTLVNIEMLRKYHFRRDYQTFIVDESHHVRGHSAVQSRKAAEIGRRTPRVYLLTATPIYNEVNDVFGQFRVLDPARFSNYDKFLWEWCRAFDNGYKVVVKGAKDKEAFSALRREYMLGRTPKDVGLELPEEVSQDLTVVTNKAWMKAYRDLKSKYRLGDEVYSNSGEVLAALRAITCQAKLAKVRELAQDRPRALWYTWYRGSAEMVAEALSTKTKTVRAIHGGLSPVQRTALAQENARKGMPTVTTIAALSEGVNFLSSYDTCIFVEEDYTPGRRYQAIGRVKRWQAADQRKYVNVLTIMVRGTVDVKVHNAIERRHTTAQAILRDEFTELPTWEDGDAMDSEYWPDPYDPDD